VPEQRREGPRQLRVAAGLVLAARAAGGLGQCLQVRLLRRVGGLADEHGREAVRSGEVLGVRSAGLLPVAALGAACITAVVVLYRRLMLSSTVPEIAEARGVRSYRIEISFLIVVALATAMTVPVVGALLIFSLMIGPPAAAQSLTSRPALAMLLSVAIALITIWAAIAASYQLNWPVGFFVGTLSAMSYGAGRSWAAWHRTRAAHAAPPAL
jgi:zinc/manganese transport system permease protein